MIKLLNTNKIYRKSDKMYEVKIPSFKNLNINNIVFDYNGTLAVDGVIKKNVKEKINRLKKYANIFILTADTFGTVRDTLKDIDIKLKIISKENGVVDKLRFIENLGAETCIAVGNGNNDRLMIKKAGLGICIIGDEGACSQTLINSDLVVNDIEDCLDILLNTDRLKATLRG